MYEELPDYHGVGFFGEDVFDLEASESMSADELRERYPETCEVLGI